MYILFFIISSATTSTLTSKRRMFWWIRVHCTLYNVHNCLCVCVCVSHFLFSSFFQFARAIETNRICCLDHHSFALSKYVKLQFRLESNRESRIKNCEFLSPSIILDFDEFHFGFILFLFFSFHSFLQTFSFSISQNRKLRPIWIYFCWWAGSTHTNVIVRNEWV